MPASRPRDAATIILLRHASDGPRVLLGRRPSRDQWANAYVFPGGRVDPSDSRVRPASPLRPHVEACLTRAASEARARALAIAAVRELFEETGLLLAKEGLPLNRHSPTWRGFAERGLAPDLEPLDLLCRAITPPYRPKRFNARFFVADAEHAQGRLGGSGELVDLRWFSIDEARALNLPNITVRVLVELEEWLTEEPKRTAQGRTPVFKMIHGVHQRLLE